MLATPHFLVGAAIATRSPEILPAALAAVMLHFVLDAVPHKDYLRKPKMDLPNVLLTIGDVVLAVALFFMLVRPELWPYAFGIGLMAMLPDIVGLPGHFWPKWWSIPGIKQLHRWHGKLLQYDRELPFAKESWPDWFWGLLPQVIVVAVAIYFILA